MQSAIPCFVCLSWLVSSSMKISALGIGTELTTGQILNRNGQWISQKFIELGVPTAMHLVVPDEENLILQSLQFCADHSDLIFVTGGLGPTSDDLTRELISKWCGYKLIWDETSWKHIQDRLLARGMAVKEIQKQQCYFPAGSEILTNAVGTANGFAIAYQGKEIFVLPGPPRELEAIWNEHLAPRMLEKTKNLDPLIIRSWDTIGLGESDVADRVEEALKGCPFEKGYRVHVPYVEVKLTYPKSKSSEGQKWIEKIEQAISSLTALRDGEEASEKLSELLNSYEHILICDEIPGSFLMTRLFPKCKKLLALKKLDFQTTPPKNPEFKTLFLHLKDEGNGFGRAELKWKGQAKSQIFQSPFQSSLLKEREQQIYAEMAMLFWMKEL